MGDLQRRGPYERLLPSEWLLADEVPEEFLRRAAVGEHMFLAPQRHARQANRLIVVIFDSGPLQLGAARLVHLALLILLARRAQAAGAKLRWGILQNTPQLHELDSSTQLKRVLNTRTWQVVGDEHLQAWRAWLAQQHPDAGECWMVGQRLPDPDGQCCTHRVLLSRSLDGQSLTCEVKAAVTRRVTLPMPDERLALQLLKGQFDGEVAAAPPLKGSVPRVAMTLPPVISSAGTHVALRMLDATGMVVIKLPAKEQKKPLEIRRCLWSAGRVPMSVTFISRSLGGVMSDDQQLSFWNIPGLIPIPKPGRNELQLTPGTATLLPVAWLRNGSAGRLFLLDSQGHLAFWTLRTGKATAQPASGRTHRLADKVMGMAKVDRERMAYVRNDGSRLYAHSINADGVMSPPHMVGKAEGVSQVLFAASSLWRRSFGGCALLSVESGCERWQIISPMDNPRPVEWVNLVIGWKGLGLLLEEGAEHYSLVLLSPNQQAISLYREGQQRVLFTTSNPIAKVSFCPISGLVAALTRSRELLVYSVRLDAMRLQVYCNQVAEKHKDDADV